MNDETHRISEQAATDVRQLFDRADHLRRAVKLAGQMSAPTAADEDGQETREA
jgi:hypothetical protein